MTVSLSSEQSYSLLQSLGTFLQKPLSLNQKIGILNQEVVILRNTSTVHDNLEQLPLLVSSAAKNIIDDLKKLLPKANSLREKIKAINERLATFTNAWIVLRTFSKGGWANEPRISPIFTETIDFLNKNYTEVRTLYYYYLREANESIPASYQWLFDEQNNIINNLRVNNHRLRKERDLTQVMLRETSSEKDKIEARLKVLAGENRNLQSQIEALEFSTQVVIQEKTVEEVLRRTNSKDLAQALADAQMKLRDLEAESSSSFPEAIEMVKRRAAKAQQDLETEKRRASTLQTELDKARSSLSIVFLLISTVSVLTLFFSRRKRA